MNPETNADELHPEKVVSLVTFSLPRGAQSGAFELDWALLTQFLNEDQNRLATLIIVRQTSENEHTASFMPSRARGTRSCPRRRFPSSCARPAEATQGGTTMLPFAPVASRRL